MTIGADFEPSHNFVQMDHVSILQLEMDLHKKTSSSSWQQSVSAFGFVSIPVQRLNGTPLKVTTTMAREHTAKWFDPLSFQLSTVGD